MDRSTVTVYEQNAAAYRAKRSAYRHERAEAFAASLPVGAIRLDLGCGPGHYLPWLGEPVVAADAAPAMVAEARRHSPDTPGVQCDLTDLPFARGSIGGIWACRAHQHIPAGALPAALAELHRVLPVGGRLALTMFATAPDRSTEPYAEDVIEDPEDFPGRWFTLWQPDVLADLLVGGGFEVESIEHGPSDQIQFTAVRIRTLPDSIGPGMRVLLCGLNPSIYSADVGTGFARPGNRFWPALRAAGLTELDRDPVGLLAADRLGMTDIVKRPTVAAAELQAVEYRTGLERITRLCALWKPGAVCFVGLAGWRTAVDRKAQPGWQPEGLGPTPVYVMPSTSGLNAHSRLADLAEHLATAAAGIGGGAP